MCTEQHTPNLTPCRNENCDVIAYFLRQLSRAFAAVADNPTNTKLNVVEELLPTAATAIRRLREFEQ